MIRVESLIVLVINNCLFNIETRIFFENREELKTGSLGNSGLPFGTRVCRWRAIAICIKTKELRRCSITPDYHRFGGFPGIGPSNDRGDAKACNHVGTAMVANHLESIRRKIEGIDEFDHTVTLEFSSLRDKLLDRSCPKHIYTLKILNTCDENCVNLLR